MYKKIVKYAIRILMWVLYPIGYLIKRDDKIWLFGGYSGFTDNTRYLFETACHDNDIRNIWISDDKIIVDILKKKGFEVYHKRSIKGIYYCYKAKVYIYSNYVSTINFYTSAGATLVNLWHGTPLKKIEYDIKQKPLFSYFKGAGLFVRLLIPEKHIKCDLILSPSLFVYDYSFRSAFRVFDKQRVIIADPPRISYLLSKHKEKNIKRNERNIAYSRRFLYAPTWRDDGSDFIKISGLDFYKLDLFLSKNNSSLYIRLHPNTKLNVDLKKLKHIFMVDIHEPTEESMLKSDCLITDYSSIYFDYLYLDKPIIFFPFDLKEYTSARELYLDYNEVTPGAKVFNQDSLLCEMEKLLNGFDSWREIRACVASKFCSLERRDDIYIIKRIKGYINDTKTDI